MEREKKANDGRGHNDNSSSTNFFPSPLHGNGTTASKDDGNGQLSLHNEINKGKHSRSAVASNHNTYIAMVIIVASITVVAVVVPAVLVSRSKQSSTPTNPNQPITTLLPPATSVPTHPISPMQRLNAFRTLLLNHSVSSKNDLYNPSSPQYQALVWLANQDGARLSVTSDTLTEVVDRYVLAAIYFADCCLNRTVSKFLSQQSICNWNDIDASDALPGLGANVFGVSCNPFQVRIGKTTSVELY